MSASVNVFLGGLAFCCPSPLLTEFYTLVCCKVLQYRIVVICNALLWIGSFIFLKVTSLTNPTIAKMCEFNEYLILLIIKIFENLNANERIWIERVCKRWNCLSKNSVEVSLPTVVVIAEILSKRRNPKSVISLWNYLTTLKIYEYRVDLENVLSVVTQSCPNL